ncbi:hypothetical protein [uncultured Pelagimonas sp.]|uniref:hypothetical protein n=1 Tax=uncultured Pelagimonas sp. TaxID=1618102 RepID=UPI002609A17F|nr:hypothetical protein [uncultured Pelagimonas sp.]
MSGLFSDLPVLRKGDTTTPKRIAYLESIGQKSIFDYIEEAKDPIEAVAKKTAWTEPTRTTIKIKAYGRDDYEVTVYDDEPGPIDVEVRGCKATVLRGFSGGFQTYTQAPEGGLGWTETGFRSWSGANVPFEREAIEAAIERYIDAPTKDGNGCGGKLKPWWSSAVTQGMNNLTFMLQFDGPDLWSQWGPEEQERIKSAKWGQIHDALKYMADNGFNPADHKPSHCKTKWPRFTLEGGTWVMGSTPKQQALEL